MAERQAGRRAAVVFTFLVLVSLACNLTSSAVPAPTAAPGSEATPSMSPTAAEPSPTPKAPLPPSDFETVLNQEVESGEVSYEQGLIRLLKSMVGDADSPLPGAYDTAVSAEGTGIVGLADDYLRDGSDDNAKAQMAQLLAALFPTTDQLHAYGQAETSQVRPAGVASPAQQADCALLWRNGFPMSGVSTYPCLSYRAGSVPGAGSYEIFYPNSWGPDDPGRAKLDLAAEAIQRAMIAYQPYGDTGPVNVIFSIFPSANDFAASVRSNHAEEGEACPMLVYPSALDFPDDWFKQALAHEVFHCFQTVNLAAQMMGTPRSVRKWWSEASAEYFSNVAFPAVDEENRFVDEFDGLSPTDSITDMAYEDVVFFQYLADVQGTGAVMQFLRDLPDHGGMAEQRAQLASYPHMQDVFHAFGQAYLDGQIADEGGDGNLPVNPALDDLVDYPGSSGFDLEAEPFVLRRLRLGFDPDLVYTITSDSSGAEGKEAVRLGGPGGGWGPIPEALNTSCPTPQSVLLITSAVAEDQPRDVAITTDTEDGGECDRCLMDVWRLDLDSYRAAFDAIRPADLPASLQAVSGDVQIVFNSDGRVYSSINALHVESLVELNLGTALLTVDMNGTSQGTLVVIPPNQLRVIHPVDDLDTQTTMTVDGAVMSMPGMDMTAPFELSGTYICEGDRLHITPIGVGVDHPGLDYIRVH